MSRRSNIHFDRDHRDHRRSAVGAKFVNWRYLGDTRFEAIKGVCGLPTLSWSLERRNPAFDCCWLLFPAFLSGYYLLRIANISIYNFQIDGKNEDKRLSKTIQPNANWHMVLVANSFDSICNFRNAHPSSGGFNTMHHMCFCLWRGHCLLFLLGLHD